jgi:hypothetical protein
MLNTISYALFTFLFGRFVTWLFVLSCSHHETLKKAPDRVYLCEYEARPQASSVPSLTSLTRTIEQRMPLSFEPKALFKEKDEIFDPAFEHDI